eukprot:284819382_4
MVRGKKSPAPRLTSARFQAARAEQDQGLAPALSENVATPRALCLSSSSKTPGSSGTQLNGTRKEISSATFDFCSLPGSACRTRLTRSCSCFKECRDAIARTMSFKFLQDARQFWHAVEWYAERNLQRHVLLLASRQRVQNKTNKVLLLLVRMSRRHSAHYVFQVPPRRPAVLARSMVRGKKSPAPRLTSARFQAARAEQDQGLAPALSENVATPRALCLSSSSKTPGSSGTQLNGTRKEISSATFDFCSLPGSACRTRLTRSCSCFKECRDAIARTMSFKFLQDARQFWHAVEWYAERNLQRHVLLLASRQRVQNKTNKVLLL